MTWTDERMAEARTKYLGKLVRRPGTYPVVGIVVNVFRYHEWKGRNADNRFDETDMRPLIQVKSLSDASPVVYWLDRNTWEVYDATTQ